MKLKWTSTIEPTESGINTFFNWYVKEYAWLVMEEGLTFLSLVPENVDPEADLRLMRRIQDELMNNAVVQENPSLIQSFQYYAKAWRMERDKAMLEHRKGNYFKWHGRVVAAFLKNAQSEVVTSGGLSMEALNTFKSLGEEFEHDQFWAYDREEFEEEWEVMKTDPSLEPYRRAARAFCLLIDLLRLKAQSICLEKDRSTEEVNKTKENETHFKLRGAARAHEEIIWRLYVGLINTDTKQGKPLIEGSLQDFKMLFNESSEAGIIWNGKAFLLAYFHHRLQQSELLKELPASQMVNVIRRHYIHKTKLDLESQFSRMKQEGIIPRDHRLVDPIIDRALEVKKSRD